MQAIQMFAQFENPPVVKSEAFPDSIPTLHGRIEWTDPGFIAMDELTVDINDQVKISLIGFLKH